jgi:aspartyl-tRNA(Asn)/glutamyl-tRNA(Gln) amidotransferase subunit A
MDIFEKIQTARGRAEASSLLNTFSLELFDEAARLAVNINSSLPLYGALCSVKDLFQLATHPTKAGTRANLPDIGAEGPALKALRAAGALFIGKVNTHELALGLTGENQWTGDVLNPVDPARQSGGSSSGSAVSVATGACDFSIGTDTAGSIRVPASYCGVIAFKPTYGAVSLAGVVPLVPSCDHIGVIARDVSLIKRVAAVLGIAPSSDNSGKRPVYGIPRDYLKDQLTAGVEREFFRFCEKYLPDSRDVSLSDPLPCIDAYTKLRRESFMFHRQEIEAHPERFSPVVLDLLKAGNVSESEYIEARAWQKAHTREIEDIFSRCDALVLPTTPSVAPPIGERHIELPTGKAALRNSVMRLTLPFSMSGVPAVSLPLLRVDGLPVGVQIVTRRHCDWDLLKYAEEILTCNY